MSTVTQKNLKIVLPRCGADEFWQLIHRHYAGSNPLRWKQLAMLALREDAEWPIERIAFLFSHSKGHVVRSLENIKCEIREQFSLSPEWHHARSPPPDESSSDGFSNPNIPN